MNSRKKIVGLATLAAVTFGLVTPASAEFDPDDYPPGCEQMDGDRGGSSAEGGGRDWTANWYAGDHITVLTHSAVGEHLTVQLRVDGPSWDWATEVIEERPAPGILSYVVPEDRQGTYGLRFWDGAGESWVEYTAYCTPAPYRNDLKNPESGDRPLGYTSGENPRERNVDASDGFARRD